MKFVHLHTHSHYSLLDGLAKIGDLVDYAKEQGAPALALTDHGVMYGAIEFYQKCIKAGIKPIIGLEAYLAPGSRLDKVAKSDEKSYHLLLLAKDYTGYKNLIKLTTIAHLEGFYYKPRIDWEVLQAHSEGLICGTACLAGEIPKLIMSGKQEKAKARIGEYLKLFGEENFYLEIQPHEHIPEQMQVNRELISLSKELGVPLIGTNDIHYLKKEDHDTQDVLLCLQTKNKKEDEQRMSMDGPDYYYKTAAEMSAAFSDAPEAISNTVKIAEMCNLEIELDKIQLPYFEVPIEFKEKNYLEYLCREGLVKRYGKTYEEVDAAIRERLDYEISVIGNMGWNSYFLIVADFVNWAKDSGIVVGPGRGSAAGSLVCYLTGITNLDPLPYDLLFERFLNPDRISMPDIDMDFADTRRDEVLEYVGNKYGKDHVAQIITFGTMAARAAVRDVGRVLGVPYDFCDKLAKMIPMFTTLSKALETVPELKEAYAKDEDAKKIIDYAKGLEGVVRHASTHACGVIIAKDALTENVPLQYASSSDRNIVSQYSLHPIEDLGLLKMDFLGLKNLTIIESAIRIIKKTRGIVIDIDNIPLDDKAAYKLFQDGETTGVFQFESSGMKRYLRELKPTEFEDIIAMVALYRPGPMEWIPDYIAGKHKKKIPTYLHPKLEPILAKTYGVAIYQEQVMQMARDLAGFTMAEADVLRKAVGKKIPKLLAEQKEKFIEGCVKNGITSQLAETIFSFIEPFAGYGFNRSHAACYALIGYQTAYLKSHWPTEFMAALLTSDQQNTDRVAIEIEESRRMGIQIYPPDVNQSFGTFTVVASDEKEGEYDIIRFGLNAVKNMGEHIVETIIEERKQNGPFKDVSDILERIGDKDLNKKSLESLIMSGALEQFGERGMMLHNVENFLSFHKEVHKTAGNGQADLFGSVPSLNYARKVKIDNAPPASRQLKLSWEKNLLGLYVTEHPYQDYQKYLHGRVIPLVELPQKPREAQLTVAGIITSIKKIITRNNESMLFVKIEDNISNVEILVFPKLLKQTAEIWQEGKVIICNGSLSDKDQEMKILCNTATVLTLENIESEYKEFKKAVENLPSRNKRFFKKNGNSNQSNSSAPKPSPAAAVPARQPMAPAPAGKTFSISFIKDLDNDSTVRLIEIFKKHSGQDKVVFNVRINGEVKKVLTNYAVDNSETLKNVIKNEFSDLIMIIE